MNLLNYASKKELEHSTYVDTCNCAAEKYFITLKPEVEKLEINELASVLTGFNNLDTKVDGLDIGEFKTVTIDLNKTIWYSK